jgi:FPC/CPF motif-containing protein YcgG
MHSNAEILTAVLAHWLQPMSEAVASIALGNKLGGINEWAKKLFPLPSNYSITQELNFLVAPTMKAMLTPAVRNMLASSGIEDSAIPQFASNLAKSMREEADRKGRVTIFDTFILSSSDIATLQDLLAKNLPITTATDEYQVLL